MMLRRGGVVVSRQAVILVPMRCFFSSEVEKKAVQQALHKRVWKRVKEEAHHYWVGTKVLGANMKVSANLLMRVSKGEVLSRRERRLLEQTVADTIRLVPFIVIAVVPFLEFSLPFLLKLFPNMLPSTYTTKAQEKTNRNAVLTVRLEMAKFLQATTSRLVEEDLQKALTDKDAKDILQRAAEGKPVTTTEIIKVGRALRAEFDLSNISHQELQAVAKFFGVNKFGPRSYVQYMLERRLKQLKEDDAMIAAEGLGSMTVEELAQACFNRGMKVEGLTRAQLEKELEDWMELADSEEVPPFLLMLSRSFDVSSRDADVAKDVIGRLVKSPKMEELLERLPHEDDLAEERARSRQELIEQGGGSSDLSASFKRADIDKDGFISVEELQELLHRLEEPLTVQQVEDELRRVDANEDGKIDFQEFVSVMRQSTSHATGQSLERELRLIRLEMAEARRELEEMDPAGAGKIASKIDSMIEDIAKELDTAEQQDAAPAKKDYSNGKLWSFPELWESSSTKKNQ